MTPRGFFTGEGNILSEIGFVASNIAGLESKPPIEQNSISESSCDNIVSTPVQFIQAYELNDSFQMFSGIEAISKTGLEQWILLAHKMKDIVKDKDK